VDGRIGSDLAHRRHGVRDGASIQRPGRGTDHKFGYLSIAGIVTVLLGGTTNLGAWNVHFGGEYQQLGDTTKSFNGGEGSQFIGSVGVGFSY